jgi:predicted nucleic acid-binding protein
MTMVDRAFVDTNVLLRMFFKHMNLHSECRLLVRGLLRQRAELWVSGQIMREFIVQATHPRTLKTPLTVEQALYEVKEVQALFRVADDTTAVRVGLLDLIRKHSVQGKQVHDTNIIATMLSLGIDTLLTINLADFRRFEPTITLISPEV